MTLTLTLTGQATATQDERLAAVFTSDVDLALPFAGMVPHAVTYGIEQRFCCRQSRPDVLNFSALEAAKFGVQDSSSRGVVRTQPAIMVERQYASRQVGKYRIEVSVFCLGHLLAVARSLLGGTDLAGHLVERTHQYTQFIAAVDRQLLAVIALGDCTSTLSKIPQGREKSLRQVDGCQQRD